jgi:hypothetical protein
MIAKENKKLNTTINKLKEDITAMEKDIEKGEHCKFLLSYDINQDRDAYLCQICINNPRNAVILPCRHFFCSICVSKLEYLICPFCRENIVEVLEVII